MKDVKPKHYKQSRAMAHEYNAKKLKKRRKHKYAIYYFLLFLLLIISGLALSLTVFFNISDIAVSNAGIYEKQEIIDASGAKQGDNLFRININQIENRLINEFIYLDSVSVKRGFPSTLLIKTQPAEVHYNISNDDKFSYVSAGGRVLEVLQEQPYENAPIVYGIDYVKDLNPGEYLSDNNDDKLTLMQKIQEVLNQNDFLDVTAIDVTNANNIKIVYQGRVSIEAGNISNVNHVIEMAKYVIENNIGPNEKGRMFMEKENNRLHFVPE